MVGPLSGKCVLITRPEQERDDLHGLLSAQGAVPVPFPTIKIISDPGQMARLKQALRSLDRFDWLIFTSQKTVALFWECVKETGTPLETIKKIRIAAIGPATERAIAERGLSVEVVPGVHIGEAVAAAVGDVRGLHILLPQAQAAREALAKSLAENGALVEEIPLYHTVTNYPDPDAWEALERGVDYVTFTSASTVRGFFEVLGSRAPSMLEKAVAACIGPVTADELKEHGLLARVVASTYTAEGLVQAMLAYAETQDQEANE